jgi:phosphatidylserine/phosphatidylglycerophosphate/cardiolipin synthase-like enzyme
MIQLSSTRAVVTALGEAETIDAQAYTLHGDVLRALKDAAQRGAQVRVRLESQPFHNPNLAKENRRIIAALRSAGADASLGDSLHAKTIKADGALYLDDQNWGRGDLVLRDDDPVEAAQIPMRKSEALAREGSLLLQRDHEGAIVETESFSRYNAVSAALEKLARAGEAPRLLVSRRDLRGNNKERAALARVASEGVAVRVCENSEKFALAGRCAWIGSANATVAFGETNLTDWGLCTDDATIVSAVRSRIEARWEAAKPFTASSQTA